ncbi:sulfotransferase [Pelagibacterales bacterium SAG-MED39]|nr:sulfotransferase [Pelagibacterales bacterium SAG-MED39]
MDNLKYLQNETSKLLNLYNASLFNDVIRKGKVLIKKFPNQILFYNATALSLSSIGQHDESLKILKKALNLQPKNIHVLNNSGLVSGNMNNQKQARWFYEKALSINENFVDALLNISQLDLSENKTKEAKKRLDRALKFCRSKGQEEIINSSLGFYYQQIGDFQKAIKCFEIVNKLNPLNTFSDKAISLIYKYKDKNDAHLKLMENKISLTKSKPHLQSLYFALGKAYEDLKEFEKSFKFLKSANNIADEKFNYNIKNDEKLFSNIKNLFKNFDKKNQINSEKKMIFIVGMPRSGTTLAEQIISSHKKVYGAGELSFLEAEIRKKILVNNDFIQSTISNIDFEKLKEIQEEYLNQVNLFDFKERIFTDKAPLNFRWIGIIKVLFPNSKIIHCQRDPMDVCFSNFKNTFTSKSISFCYNLNKLGHYYNLYSNLMNFWKQLFNDEIYDLSYEKLINNQEEETKNLLKYCDLEWDINCLSPHKNEKLVATASLAQVRSPIYKSSIKKWQNYSDNLKDLRNIIND